MLECLEIAYHCLHIEYTVYIYIGTCIYKYTIYFFVVNMYFESNKLARRVGKMDIVTAKMIFLKEVEESGLLTSLQLKEL